MKQDRRRTRKLSTLALTGALVLPALPAPALAGAPAGSGTENSWRDSAPFNQISSATAFLADRGVTFGGFLQLDGSHVLSGGLPDSLAFDAQRLLDINATLDTQKLLGWPGGTLFLDVQSHSGSNVITHQVPALADPDNMDAYAETSVDRAWYQQDLLGQKGQLQLGLMYVDDQFFTVPYGQNFISLDFSSDASISTFVLPTFPKGAWGGDVFLYPDSHLSFAAGLFKDHATELSYDPGGQLLVTEEAWQGRWGGLPLKLQVGAWLDTGRFRRFLGGTVHRAAAVYLVASEKLWQPAGSADRGIGMFLQYGTAPASVAAVRQHIGFGLVWTGLAASRPHDEIGIAFSDSLLTAENRFRYGYESELEGYYQFDASHGWTIQPDFEYWRHPSGGITPPTVLGAVRVMYSF
ncbi:MAG: carbohydrate porin [Steroidobacteraceae bacterium]